jgi:adenylylsulfate kinase
MPFLNGAALQVIGHPARSRTMTDGATVWLIGLPSARKSTFARTAAKRITMPGEVLDGDHVRAQFFPQLRYTRADRNENVRRIGRFVDVG